MQRRRGWPGRGLKVAVKNTDATDPEEDEEDEEFERLSISVSAEQRPDVDEGLAHAKKALGKNPPKWQRYVALCQEFLSVHPPPDDGGGGDPLLMASAKIRWSRSRRCCIFGAW